MALRIWINLFSGSEDSIHPHRSEQYKKIKARANSAPGPFGASATSGESELRWAELRNLAVVPAHVRPAPVGGKGSSSSPQTAC
jgi:hypothetical protein